MWDKARAFLEPAYRAHHRVLTEVRTLIQRITQDGVRSLPEYWAALGIGAHKGLDTTTGWKDGVLGEGNLWWKQDICDFLCRAFTPLFRELPGEVLSDRDKRDENFRVDEYTRYVSDCFTARLGNQRLTNAEGETINDWNYQIDVASMDLQTPGIIPILDSIWAYTNGRWGGTTAEAREMKIRGYGEMSLHDVAEHTEITDESELGKRLLECVNVGRSGRAVLNHVDEISLTDLTEPVTSDADVRRLVASEGFMGEEIGGDQITGELTARLGKTRFMRDLKTATLHFFHGYYRNMGLTQDINADLRWRNNLRGAAPDSTVMMELRDTSLAVSRLEDRDVRVDGRRLRGRRAREAKAYAKALWHAPWLLRDFLCSEDDSVRRILSPSYADPRNHGKRVNDFSSYLNQHPALTTIAPLAGAADVNAGALLDAILCVRTEFERQDEHALDYAIEHARDSPESVGYHARVINAAFNAASGRGIGPGRDDDIRKSYTNRLLTKYSTELRELREAVQDPYDIETQHLASPTMRQASAELRKKIEADVFDGEFSRIGKAFEDEIVHQEMKGAEASREYVGEQVYYYLQHVSVIYDSQGKLEQKANTYGTTNPVSGKTRTSRLMDSLSTCVNGNFSIDLHRVRQERAEAIAIQPVTGEPMSNNATVMRGMRAENGEDDPLPADRIDMIQVFDEDPYLRPLVDHYERNQQAYREVHAARAEGPIDADGVRAILTQSNVHESHAAYGLLDAPTVDLDEVEDELKNTRDNALRATAAGFGLQNPDLESFKSWVNLYGNSLLDYRDGRYEAAIDGLESGEELIKQFTYVEGAEDRLDAITLKQKCRARVALIDEKTDDNLSPQTGFDVDAQISLLEAEATGAWRKSRGERAEEDLNKSKDLGESIGFWLRQRFVYPLMRVKAGEDYEAASLVAKAQILKSNRSKVTGVKQRKWAFGATAVGAGVAIGVSPWLWVPTAAAGGSILLFERLGVASSWVRKTDRITDQLGSNLNYRQFCKFRRSQQTLSETEDSIGSRSWLRPLRSNVRTHDIDSLGSIGLRGRFGGLPLHDSSAERLNPYSRPMVFAHEYSLGRGEEAKPMITLYADTVPALNQKETALKHAARESQASKTVIESQTPTVEDTPSVVRLTSKLARNSSMPHGTERAFGVFNYFSRFWGVRGVTSKIDKAVERGELAQPNVGDSVDNTLSQTYGRLAGEKPPWYERILWRGTRKAYAEKRTGMKTTAQDKWRKRLRGANMSPYTDWAVAMSALRVEAQVKKRELREGKLSVTGENAEAALAELDRVIKNTTSIELGAPQETELPQTA